jgi:ankyrin repeat protein
MDALAHAVMSDHGELIGPLLAPMNAPQRNEALRSALYVASTQNKANAIGPLVDAGAAIEAFYTVAIERRRTPLMLAISNGHVEAAQALLRAGANPNKERSAADPFMLAIRAKYDRVGEGETPRRTQLLLSLLDAGADATSRRIAERLAIATSPQSYGLEPVVERLLAQGKLPVGSVSILLESALRACNMEFVERIIAAGGQPLLDAKEPKLMAAAVHCPDHASVDYLVQRGFAVDQRVSNRNDTPLMYAAQTGHVELAKYLLAHQADPTLVGSNGQDAAMIAVKHSELRIFKMLRELQK